MGGGRPGEPGFHMPRPWAEIRASDHAQGGLFVPSPLLPEECELGQVVGLGDTFQLVLEAPVGPFRAGFLEQGWQGDCEAWPAVAAGVLAGDAVEPPLPAACDGEISGATASTPPSMRMPS